ncbi:MAG: toxin-antitoxin system YwqK family antitoxin, partial [Ignavibacteria bacterium]
EGSWEYYCYDNGNLYSKGNYKNGVKEGSWEYYYNNGNLQSKGNFKNGKQEGYWEYYYETNDRLQAMGSFNNDKHLPCGASRNKN